jgi:hypothetical protein
VEVATFGELSLRFDQGVLLQAGSLLSQELPLLLAHDLVGIIRLVLGLLLLLLKGHHDAILLALQLRQLPPLGLPPHGLDLPGQHLLAIQACLLVNC